MSALLKEAYDWEVGVFSQVFNLPYSFGVGNEEVDKIIWTSSSSNGKFSARLFDEVLTTWYNNCFPWKSIWSRKVPFKAIFFVWTTSLGNILTMDNLRNTRLLLLNGVHVQKEW